LIKQAYGADPLVWPRCRSTLRTIAFVERPAVIEKALTYLALWPTLAHTPDSLTAWRRRVRPPKRWRGWGCTSGVSGPHVAKAKYRLFEPSLSSEVPHFVTLNSRGRLLLLDSRAFVQMGRGTWLALTLPRMV